MMEALGRVGGGYRHGPRRPAWRSAQEFFPRQGASPVFPAREDRYIPGRAALSLVVDGCDRQPERAMYAPLIHMLGFGRISTAFSLSAA
jgi:hypothetical protein